jgi:hypothetical protein
MKKEEIIDILKAANQIDDRNLFVKAQVRQSLKIDPKNPKRPLRLTENFEAYLSICNNKLYLIQHSMMGKPIKVRFESEFKDLIAFEMKKGPLGLSKDVQIANHEMRYQMLVMLKNKEQAQRLIDTVQSN